MLVPRPPWRIDFVVPASISNSVEIESSILAGMVSAVAPVATLAIGQKTKPATISAPSPAVKVMDIFMCGVSLGLRLYGILVKSRASGAQLAPAAGDLRRQVRVDPGLDVRHDLLLADVGQQIMKVPLVQLQRLVLRAGLLVELPAAARLRHLVRGAVQDEERQGDP